VLHSAQASRQAGVVEERIHCHTDHYHHITTTTLTPAKQTHHHHHHHHDQARFNDCLRFIPSFFDALCALGQLEFDRAKLRARLVVVSPAPGAPTGGDAKPAAEGDKAAEGEGDKAAAAAAAAAAADGPSAALKAALKRIKKSDVEAARSHMKKAAEWYKKALAAAEAADAKRKAEAAASKAESEATASEAAASEAAPASEGESFRGQAMIMEGNVLYEWSQLLAAVGLEWKATLDAAVERFKGASCSDGECWWWWGEAWRVGGLRQLWQVFASFFADVLLLIPPHPLC